MAKHWFVAAAAVVLWLEAASAHPPDDLKDLVGARAAGGETALQSRNYVSARTQGLAALWWNEQEGVCVRVVTANGRYTSVDIVPPRACGHAPGHPHAVQRSGCPVDVSEADRYKYPDCDRNAAAPGGNVPQAALDACQARADAYQNVVRGTSVIDGATQSGGNWILKAASGTYKATCTVTPGGRVVSITPGW